MEEEQDNQNSQRKTVLVAIVAAVIAAVILWFVIFSNSTTDEEVIPTPIETPITEESDKTDVTAANPYLSEDTPPLPADIAGAQTAPVAEDVTPTTPTGTSEVIMALSLAALIGGLFALKQIVPIKPRS